MDLQTVVFLTLSLWISLPVVKASPVGLAQFQCYRKIHGQQCDIPFTSRVGHCRPIRDCPIFERSPDLMIAENMTKHLNGSCHCDSGPEMVCCAKNWERKENRTTLLSETQAPSRLQSRSQANTQSDAGESRVMPGENPVDPDTWDYSIHPDEQFPLLNSRPKSGSSSRHQPFKSRLESSQPFVSQSYQQPYEGPVQSSNSQARTQTSQKESSGYQMDNSGSRISAHFVYSPTGRTHKSIWQRRSGKPGEWRSLQSSIKTSSEHSIAPAKSTTPPSENLPSDAQKMQHKVYEGHGQQQQSYQYRYGQQNNHGNNGPQSGPYHNEKLRTQHQPYQDQHGQQTYENSQRLAHYPGHQPFTHQSRSWQGQNAYSQYSAERSSVQPGSYNHYYPDNAQHGFQPKEKPADWNVYGQRPPLENPQSTYFYNPPLPGSQSQGYNPTFSNYGQPASNVYSQVPSNPYMQPQNSYSQYPPNAYIHPPIVNTNPSPSNMFPINHWPQFQTAYNQGPGLLPPPPAWNSFKVQIEQQGFLPNPFFFPPNYNAYDLGTSSNQNVHPLHGEINQPGKVSTVTPADNKPLEQPTMKPPLPAFQVPIVPYNVPGYNYYLSQMLSTFKPYGIPPLLPTPILPVPPTIQSRIAGNTTSTISTAESRGYPGSFSGHTSEQNQTRQTPITLYNESEKVGTPDLTERHLPKLGNTTKRLHVNPTILPSLHQVYNTSIPLSSTPPGIGILITIQTTADQKSASAEPTVADSTTADPTEAKENEEINSIESTSTDESEHIDSSESMIDEDSSEIGTEPPTVADTVFVNAPEQSLRPTEINRTNSVIATVTQEPSITIEIPSVTDQVVYNPTSIQTPTAGSPTAPLTTAQTVNRMATQAPTALSIDSTETDIPSKQIMLHVRPADAVDWITTSTVAGNAFDESEHYSKHFGEIPLVTELGENDPTSNQVMNLTPRRSGSELTDLALESSTELQTVTQPKQTNASDQTGPDFDGENNMSTSEIVTNQTSQVPPEHTNLQYHVTTFSPISVLEPPLMTRVSSAEKSTSSVEIPDIVPHEIQGSVSEVGERAGIIEMTLTPLNNQTLADRELDTGNIAMKNNNSRAGNVSSNYEQSEGPPPTPQIKLTSNQVIHMSPKSDQNYDLAESEESKSTDSLSNVKYVGNTTDLSSRSELGTDTSSIFDNVDHSRGNVANQEPAIQTASSTDNIMGEVATTKESGHGLETTIPSANELATTKNVTTVDKGIINNDSVLIPKRTGTSNELLYSDHVANTASDKLLNDSSKDFESTTEKNRSEMVTVELGSEGNKSINQTHINDFKQLMENVSTPTDSTILPQRQFDEADLKKSDVKNESSSIGEPISNTTEPNGTLFVRIVEANENFTELKGNQLASTTSSKPADDGRIQSIGSAETSIVKQFEKIGTMPTTSAITLQQRKFDDVAENETSFASQFVSMSEQLSNLTGSGNAVPNVSTSYEQSDMPTPTHEAKTASLENTEIPSATKLPNNSTSSLSSIGSDQSVFPDKKASVHLSKSAGTTDTGNETGHNASITAKSFEPINVTEFGKVAEPKLDPNTTFIPDNRAKLQGNQKLMISSASNKTGEAANTKELIDRGLETEHLTETTTSNNLDTVTNVSLVMLKINTMLMPKWTDGPSESVSSDEMANNITDKTDKLQIDSSEALENGTEKNSTEIVTAFLSSELNKSRNEMLGQHTDHSELKHFLEDTTNPTTLTTIFAQRLINEPASETSTDELANNSTGTTDKFLRNTSKDIENVTEKISLMTDPTENKSPSPSESNLLKQPMENSTMPIASTTLIKKQFSDVALNETEATSELASTSQLVNNSTDMIKPFLNDFAENVAKKDSELASTTDSNSLITSRSNLPKELLEKTSTTLATNLVQRQFGDAAFNETEATSEFVSTGELVNNATDIINPSLNDFAGTVENVTEKESELAGTTDSNSPITSESNLPKELLEKTFTTLATDLAQSRFGDAAFNETEATSELVTTGELVNNATDIINPFLNDFAGTVENFTKKDSELASTTDSNSPITSESNLPKELLEQTSTTLATNLAQRWFGDAATSELVSTGELVKNATDLINPFLNDFAVTVENVTEKDSELTSTTDSNTLITVESNLPEELLEKTSTTLATNLAQRRFGEAAFNETEATSRLVSTGELVNNATDIINPFLNDLARTVENVTEKDSELASATDSNSPITSESNLPKELLEKTSTTLATNLAEKRLGDAATSELVSTGELVNNATDIINPLLDDFAGNVENVTEKDNELANISDSGSPITSESNLPKDLLEKTSTTLATNLAEKRLGDAATSELVSTGELVNNATDIINPFLNNFAGTVENVTEKDIELASTTESNTLITSESNLPKELLEKTLATNLAQRRFGDAAFNETETTSELVSTGELVNNATDIIKPFLNDFAGTVTEKDSELANATDRNSPITSESNLPKELLEKTSTTLATKLAQRQFDDAAFNETEATSELVSTGELVNNATDIINPFLNNFAGTVENVTEKDIELASTTESNSLITSESNLPKELLEKTLATNLAQRRFGDAAFNETETTSELVSTGELVNNATEITNPVLNGFAGTVENVTEKDSELASTTDSNSPITSASNLPKELLEKTSTTLATNLAQRRFGDAAFNETEATSELVSASELVNNAADIINPFLNDFDETVENVTEKDSELASTTDSNTLITVESNLPDELLEKTSTTLATNLAQRRFGEAAFNETEATSRLVSTGELVNNATDIINPFLNDLARTVENVTEKDSELASATDSNSPITSESNLPKELLEKTSTTLATNLAKKRLGDAATSELVSTGELVNNATDIINPFLDDFAGNVENVTEKDNELANISDSGSPITSESNLPKDLLEKTSTTLATNLAEKRLGDAATSELVSTGELVNNATDIINPFLDDFAGNVENVTEKDNELANISDSSSPITSESNLPKDLLEKTSTTLATKLAQRRFGAAFNETKITSELVSTGELVNNATDIIKPFLNDFAGTVTEKDSELANATDRNSPITSESNLPKELLEKTSTTLATKLAQRQFDDAAFNETEATSELVTTGELVNNATDIINPFLNNFAGTVENVTEKDSELASTTDSNSPITIASILPKELLEKTSTTLATNLVQRRFGDAAFNETEATSELLSTGELVNNATDITNPVLNGFAGTVENVTEKDSELASTTDSNSPITIASILPKELLEKTSTTLATNLAQRQFGDAAFNETEATSELVSTGELVNNATDIINPSLHDFAGTVENVTEKDSELASTTDSNSPITSESNLPKELLEKTSTTLATNLAQRLFGEAAFNETEATSRLVSTGELVNNATDIINPFLNDLARTVENVTEKDSELAITTDSNSPITSESNLPKELLEKTSTTLATNLAEKRLGDAATSELVSTGELVNNATDIINPFLDDFAGNVENVTEKDNELANISDSGSPITSKSNLPKDLLEKTSTTLATKLAQRRFGAAFNETKITGELVSTGELVNNATDIINPFLNNFAGTVENVTEKDSELASTTDSNSPITSASNLPKELLEKTSTTLATNLAQRRFGDAAFNETEATSELVRTGELVNNATDITNPVLNGFAGTVENVTEENGDLASTTDSNSPITFESNLPKELLYRISTTLATSLGQRRFGDAAFNESEATSELVSTVELVNNATDIINPFLKDFAGTVENATEKNGDLASTTGSNSPITSASNLPKELLEKTSTTLATNLAQRRFGDAAFNETEATSELVSASELVNNAADIINPFLNDFDETVENVTEKDSELASTTDSNTLITVESNLPEELWEKTSTTLATNLAQRRFGDAAFNETETTSELVSTGELVNNATDITNPVLNSFAGTVENVTEKDSELASTTGSNSPITVESNLPKELLEKTSTTLATNLAEKRLGNATTSELVSTGELVNNATDIINPFLDDFARTVENVTEKDSELANTTDSNSLITSESNLPKELLEKTSTTLATNLAHRRFSDAAFNETETTSELDSTGELANNATDIIKPFLNDFAGTVTEKDSELANATDRNSPITSESNLPKDLLKKTSTTLATNLAQRRFDAAFNETKTTSELVSTGELVNNATDIIKPFLNNFAGTVENVTEKDSELASTKDSNRLITSESNLPKELLDKTFTTLATNLAQRRFGDATSELVSTGALVNNETDIINPFLDDFAGTVENVTEENGYLASTTDSNSPITFESNLPKELLYKISTTLATSLAQRRFGDAAFNESEATSELVSTVELVNNATDIINPFLKDFAGTVENATEKNGDLASTTGSNSLITSESNLSKELLEKTPTTLATNLAHRRFSDAAFNETETTSELDSTGELVNNATDIIKPFLNDFAGTVENVTEKNGDLASTTDSNSPITSESNLSKELLEKTSTTLATNLAQRRFSDAAFNETETTSELVTTGELVNNATDILNPFLNDFAGTVENVTEKNVSRLENTAESESPNTSQSKISKALVVKTSTPSEIILAQKHFKDALFNDSDETSKVYSLGELLKTTTITTIIDAVENVTQQYYSQSENAAGTINPNKSEQTLTEQPVENKTTAAVWTNALAQRQFNEAALNGTDNKDELLKNIVDMIKNETKKNYNQTQNDASDIRINQTETNTDKLLDENTTTPVELTTISTQRRLNVTYKEADVANDAFNASELIRNSTRLNPNNAISNVTMNYEHTQELSRTDESRPSNSEKKETLPVTNMVLNDYPGGQGTDLLPRKFAPNGDLKDTEESNSAVASVNETIGHTSVADRSLDEILTDLSNASALSSDSKLLPNIATTMDNPDHLHGPMANHKVATLITNSSENTTVETANTNEPADRLETGHLEKTAPSHKDLETADMKTLDMGMLSNDTVILPKPTDVPNEPLGNDDMETEKNSEVVTSFVRTEENKNISQFGPRNINGINQLLETTTPIVSTILTQKQFNEVSLIETDATSESASTNELISNSTEPIGTLLINILDTLENVTEKNDNQSANAASNAEANDSQNQAAEVTETNIPKQFVENSTTPTISATILRQRQFYKIANNETSTATPFLNTDGLIINSTVPVGLFHINITDTLENVIEKNDNKSANTASEPEAKPNQTVPSTETPKQFVENSTKPTASATMLIEKQVYKGTDNETITVTPFLSTGKVFIDSSEPIGTLLINIIGTNETSTENNYNQLAIAYSSTEESEIPNTISGSIETSAAKQLVENTTIPTATENVLKQRQFEDATENRFESANSSVNASGGSNSTESIHKLLLGLGEDTGNIFEKNANESAADLRLKGSQRSNQTTTSIENRNVNFENATIPRKTEETLTQRQFHQMVSTTEITINTMTGLSRPNYNLASTDQQKEKVAFVEMTTIIPDASVDQQGLNATNSVGNSAVIVPRKLNNVGVAESISANITLTAPGSGSSSQNEETNSTRNVVLEQISATPEARSITLIPEQFVKTLDTIGSANDSTNLAALKNRGINLTESANESDSKQFSNSSFPAWNRTLLTDKPFEMRKEAAENNNLTEGVEGVIPNETGASKQKGNTEQVVKQLVTTESNATTLTLNESLSQTAEIGDNVNSNTDHNTPVINSTMLIPRKLEMVAAEAENANNTEKESGMYASTIDSADQSTVDKTTDPVTPKTQTIKQTISIQLTTNAPSVYELNTLGPTEATIAMTAPSPLSLLTLEDNVGNAPTPIPISVAVLDSHHFKAKELLNLTGKVNGNETETGQAALNILSNQSEEVFPTNNGSSETDRKANAAHGAVLAPRRLQNKGSITEVSNSTNTPTAKLSTVAMIDNDTEIVSTNDSYSDLSLTKSGVTSVLASKRFADMEAVAHVSNGSKELQENTSIITVEELSNETALENDPYSEIGQTKSGVNGPMLVPKQLEGTSTISEGSNDTIRPTENVSSIGLNDHTSYKTSPASTTKLDLYNTETSLNGTMLAPKRLENIEVVVDVSTTSSNIPSNKADMATLSDTETLSASNNYSDLRQNESVINRSMRVPKDLMSAEAMANVSNDAHTPVETIPTLNDNATETLLTNNTYSVFHNETRINRTLLALKLLQNMEEEAKVSNDTKTQDKDSAEELYNGTKALGEEESMTDNDFIEISSTSRSNLDQHQSEVEVNGSMLASKRLKNLNAVDEVYNGTNTSTFITTTTTPQLRSEEIKPAIICKSYLKAHLQSLLADSHDESDESDIKKGVAETSSIANKRDHLTDSLPPNICKSYLKTYLQILFAENDQSDLQQTDTDNKISMITAERLNNTESIDKLSTGTTRFAELITKVPAQPSNEQHPNLKLKEYAMPTMIEPMPLDKSVTSVPSGSDPSLTVVDDRHNTESSVGVNSSRTSSKHVEKTKAAEHVNDTHELSSDTSNTQDNILLTSRSLVENFNRDNSSTMQNESVFVPTKFETMVANETIDNATSFNINGKALNSLNETLTATPSTVFTERYTSEPFSESATLLVPKPYEKLDIANKVLNSSTGPSNKMLVGNASSKVISESSDAVANYEAALIPKRLAKLEFDNPNEETDSNLPQKITNATEAPSLPIEGSPDSVASKVQLTPTHSTLGISDQMGLNENFSRIADVPGTLLVHPQTRPLAPLTTPTTDVTEAPDESTPLTVATYSQDVSSLFSISPSPAFDVVFPSNNSSFSALSSTTSTPRVLFYVDGTPILMPEHIPITEMKADCEDEEGYSSSDSGFVDGEVTLHSNPDPATSTAKPMLAFNEDDSTHESEQISNMIL